MAHRGLGERQRRHELAHADGLLLRASRLTIFTRAGSASARNSVAVAAASSSERLGVVSGAQQVITGSSVKSITVDV
jgi:hypothetical protein